MLPLRLFDFAFFPRWEESIDELAAMAMPEKWAYQNTQSIPANPLLIPYINGVYRLAASAYNDAGTPEERDALVTLRHDYAAFSTNLYTPQYNLILAYFARNTRPGERRWYFKGWATEGNSMLARAAPLPRHVPHASGQFRADWPIRVNTRHISEDAENVARLPAAIRSHPMLPLLLETAVELARRKAAISPGIVVPQYYLSCKQYLLPIFLTDPDRAELALTLQPGDGYYTGSTMLTLRMAYINARILERPAAPWLYGAFDGGDVHGT